MQEVERPIQIINLGSTYDSATVNVSALPEVIFQNATLGNTSANFNYISGDQLRILTLLKVDRQSVDMHSQRLHSA